MAIYRNYLILTRISYPLNLNLVLDKSARQSDFSRRPLDHRQMSYAALAAFAALMLYVNQTTRNLNGEYRGKTIDSAQGLLPLDDAPATQTTLPPVLTEETGQSLPMDKLSDAAAAALLGIVTELPSRYSPEQLSVSLGQESRVGLSGWIVDNRLGRDAELDEETVKMMIADLRERRLLRITETRRLEATDEGARLWQRVKQK